MERESFEDEEAARLMNDTFISIKVDKEERPDIDNIYMTVCQAMTGSGGWPLTIFMTPDKKPFFSATYIPKENKYGGVGLIELIKKVDYLWKHDNKALLASANDLTEQLHSFYKADTGELIGEDILDETFTQLESLFDSKYGGFGIAPKFPSPHNLLFLLRYYRRNNNKKALNMVTETLDAMSIGGIFDHIGYGFHRYSTDREWLVPHFEKMLYDQAMISIACTEAYQATQNKKYRIIADKIFEYIINDMKSGEGTFFSAEDADSEGVEGKFYVWTADEIKKILSSEDASVAMKAYSITNEGNFREEATRRKSGLNILHLKKDIENLSKELNINSAELEAKLDKIRKQLKNVRDKRIRPIRDNKVLTDWNGLVIAALAKAAIAFGNENYIQLAKTSADFFLSSFIKNGRLLHRYIEGQWDFNGNIDDYAFLIFGLTELYEASFDVKYLKQAFALNEQLIKLFWDEEAGGFYFTAKDGEDNIIRTKEVYDGAIPSGNSIALLNLIRLSRIFGDSRLEQYAEKLQKTFSNTVENAPLGYTQFLSAVDYILGPSSEIVICGKRNSEDTKNMIAELNKWFIPNKAVIFNPADEDDSEIISIAPYVNNQKALEGKATAYVCKNFACGRPTVEIDEMLKNLGLTNSVM